MRIEGMRVRVPGECTTHTVARRDGQTASDTSAGVKGPGVSSIPCL
jgi:hypothetical protein